MINYIDRDTDQVEGVINFEGITINMIKVEDERLNCAHVTTTSFTDATYCHDCRLLLVDVSDKLLQKPN